MSELSEKQDEMKSVASERELIMSIDEKGIFDISVLRDGMSCPPTLRERTRAYRSMLSGNHSFYKGIRGILLASVHILRNESKSLFRCSQQKPVRLNESAIPEFDTWAKAMEGLHERPQCGQGSEATASSSLRSSSSVG